MATIHHTTLVPSKLELLTVWLPTQPWYRGAAPLLAQAGGFRLDDPAGEVGIQLMVVTDAAGADVVTYLAPMTYRAAPLDGGTLIGTTEHGVLGTRYVYDAPSDPVFRSVLRALIAGDAEPQAQSQSDTADPTVLVGRAANPGDVEVVRVLEVTDGAPAAGEVSVPWALPDGTQVRGVVARAA